MYAHQFKKKRKETLRCLPSETLSAGIVKRTTFINTWYIYNNYTGGVGGYPTCPNTWRRMSYHTLYQPYKYHLSREKAHVTTNSIRAGAYFLSNSVPSTNRKYTSLTILLPLPPTHNTLGCAPPSVGYCLSQLTL